MEEIIWHYRPTMRQLARDLLKENGALRNPEHPLYLQWMEKFIDRVDGVTLNTRFLGISLWRDLSPQR